jgi:nucleoside-diphosphate-sugar epimerase
LLHILVYSNIVKGKTPNWMGDPDAKHCFTYTPDAARATAMLGNTPEAYNQVWHLPTNIHGLTGREYVSIFAAETKSADKLSVVPLWMVKILGWFMPLMKELPEMMYQYDRDYLFDSSTFERKFNFKPTPYQQGIRQMIEAETKKAPL